MKDTILRIEDPIYALVHCHRGDISTGILPLNIVTAVLHENEVLAILEEQLLPEFIRTLNWYTVSETRYKRYYLHIISGSTLLALAEGLQRLEGKDRHFLFVLPGYALAYVPLAASDAFSSWLLSVLGNMSTT